ncbi:MAG: type IV secretory system conjugative DNA transfer family protein [Ruminococcaceae bacterium]|nr:type IV secretory system conjugative DNA transfer family protein [Oscillospiraceae bacterium]
MSKKKKNKLREQIEDIVCGYVDNPCAGYEPHRIAAGIPLAMRGTYSDAQLVGIPQGREGHAIIFGGSGSGKSTGPIMAALNTWEGGMVVTDPKGELYRYYKDLYDNRLVERPPLLFDPTQADSIKYDPFWFLAQNEDDLVSNISEIVHAMIPMPIDCREPYWVDTKRAVLEAGILYYHRLGLNFSETLSKLITEPLSKMLETLSGCGDPSVKVIIGSMIKLKPEELASHDRGLRNELMVWTTDKRINNAFDCVWKRDDDCFCWNDLSKFNIFIRIPEERIEQWSAPVRLMLTQLFGYLERRPDKFTDKIEPSILLMLDEFARFGKIEGITNALCTLRSKNVNVVLALQSFAQLDKHYGIEERRIIFDNCQYKLILQASDPETQSSLSNLIGVHKKSCTAADGVWTPIIKTQGTASRKAKHICREYFLTNYLP